LSGGKVGCIKVDVASVGMISVDVRCAGGEPIEKVETPKWRFGDNPMTYPDAVACADFDMTCDTHLSYK
jgi:hypothetical protein